MAVTLEEFKQLGPKTTQNILYASAIYTVILGILTLTTFAVNLNPGASHVCNEYHEIYYINTGDKIEFYENNITGTSSAQLCLDSDIEHSKAPLLVSIVAIAIFIIYLLHSIQSYLYSSRLSRVLKVKGDIEMAKFLNSLSFCAGIQAFCVELCGLFLLFAASSATDVIINSSATIFLGEVDDLLILLIIDFEKNQLKLKQTVEVFGIEMEYDPTEDPEVMKKQNKKTTDIEVSKDNSTPSSNPISEGN